MSANARLRAFVAVADTGSVRAAAARLFITESSVSAAVTALGKEVGVPLVERVGRGLRLTPSGQRYADYARKIIGLHEEGVAAARGELDPERGLVRLAAVTTAGEHIVPRLLASFRAEHPDVQLQLEVGNRDRVWPKLANHEADIVLAGRPPEGLGLHVRAVRPNSIIVVGAPEVADKFTVDSATWLMREEGSGTRATCRALLATFDALPPLLTLGSNGAVVAGALAGLGVTLVSRDAVSTALAEGTLVELPVPGTPIDRPWHAVTNDPFSASTKLLVRHLLREPRWVTVPPA